MLPEYIITYKAKEWVNNQTIKSEIRYLKRYFTKGDMHMANKYMKKHSTYNSLKNKN